MDAVTGDFSYTGRPPTGATRLSEWLDEHAGDVGRVYASELARHYR